MDRYQYHPKEESMPTTRQHIKHAASIIAFPAITFIAGASLGLVSGFLIAWLLCLKLLSILVLIPLGPYP